MEQMTNRKTSRKTDREMDDIRRSAMTTTCRWALVNTLESLHASPEDAADALLADLFRYGGTLSTASDHVKSEGRHRVLLRLHGLTVGGTSVEDAALTWLTTAPAKF